jgi:hypothetical protein
VQLTKPTTFLAAECGDGSDFSDSLDEVPDDQLLLKYFQNQSYKRKQAKNNYNPLVTPKFVHMADVVHQSKGG